MQKKSPDLKSTAVGISECHDHVVLQMWLSLNEKNENCVILTNP